MGAAVRPEARSHRPKVPKGPAVDGSGSGTSPRSGDQVVAGSNLVPDRLMCIGALLVPTRRWPRLKGWNDAAVAPLGALVSAGELVRVRRARGRRHPGSRPVARRTARGPAGRRAVRGGDAGYSPRPSFCVGPGPPSDRRAWVVATSLAARWPGSSGCCRRPRTTRGRRGPRSGSCCRRAVLGHCPAGQHRHRTGTGAASRAPAGGRPGLAGRRWAGVPGSRPSPWWPHRCGSRARRRGCSSSSGWPVALAMAVAMAAVTGVGAVRLVDRVGRGDADAGFRTGSAAHLCRSSRHRGVRRSGRRLGGSVTWWPTWPLSIDHPPVTRVVIGGRRGRPTSWLRASGILTEGGLAARGCLDPQPDRTRGGVGTCGRPSCCCRRDVLDAPVVLAEPPRRRG